MRTFFNYSLFALVFCAYGAGHGHASAQEDNDAIARRHYRAGEAYYEKAKYQKSIEEFQEAYDLSHRAPLLINIARAHGKLEQYQQAIDKLDEYVTKHPAEKNIADAAQLRTKYSKQLQIQQAQEAREAKLREEAKAKAARPMAILWIGLGGGALLGGAALVLGLLANRDYNILADNCGDCLNDAANQKAKKRGPRLALASTVLTFTAVGVAVTGLVLWLLVKKKKPLSDTALQILPGPSPLGFSLGRNF